MRFRILLLILTSILLFESSLILAEEKSESPANGSPVIVRAELDNAILTIGDRATYKLSIERPAKVGINSIDTVNTLKDFEIKDEKTFESRNKETVIEGKTFVITNFQIGQYVLEPATISYTTPNGEQKTAESNKLYVTIETVDKSGKDPEDIRGIKGVVKLRSKIIQTIRNLGIIALLALLGFFIWNKYFKKAKILSRHAESSLSPHEEAYRALSQLFDSDLLRRAQYKAYCSELTEILKRYLERRYQFLALESTTFELMRHLKGFGIEREAFQKIDSVMNFCDLVKFAKLAPQPAELIEINRSAQSIIDLTKQIETPIPTATSTESSA